MDKCLNIGWHALLIGSRSLRAADAAPSEPEGKIGALNWFDYSRAPRNSALLKPFEHEDGWTQERLASTPFDSYAGGLGLIPKPIKDLTHEAFRRRDGAPDFEEERSFLTRLSRKLFCSAFSLWVDRAGRDAAGAGSWRTGPKGAATVHACQTRPLSVLRAASRVVADSGTLVETGVVVPGVLGVVGPGLPLAVDIPVLAMVLAAVALAVVVIMIRRPGGISMMMLVISLSPHNRRYSQRWKHSRMRWWAPANLRRAPGQCLQWPPPAE